MDEIYVNVAIHEDRAHHYFAKDRQKQLKQYPPNAKDCKFAKAEDILDKRSQECSRCWPSWDRKDVINAPRWVDFGHLVKLLMKMKITRLSSSWSLGVLMTTQSLSLRELLAGAETVQCLDDSVWEFVQNESTKVLLIFDGLDEYSRKEEIEHQEDYKNNVEEKMPVSVLYKKLAEGKLLRGASILTTTRPTAVKYVAHVNFQRTVEILGFTSENVEDYVENFTRGCTPKQWRKCGNTSSPTLTCFHFATSQWTVFSFATACFKSSFLSLPKHCQRRWRTFIKWP